MIKTTLYTWDEVDKAIKALCEKHNIQILCDGLPYYPKGLDIYLTGSTAEPVENKADSDSKILFEHFKEKFDKESNEFEKEADELERDLDKAINSPFHKKA